MADRSSGRVHTAEETIGAEKFRELANLIDEILPALELSADQRDHLKAGAAEIRELLATQIQSQRLCVKRLKAC